MKLTDELLSLSPQHVAAAYALNPLTIATCVSMSTGVFHNFILSLVLLVILRGIFITSLFSIIFDLSALTLLVGHQEEHLACKN